MSELCLLAASLLAQGQAPGLPLPVPLSKLPGYLPVAIDASFSRLCESSTKVVGAKLVMPTVEFDRPQFSDRLSAPSSPLPTGMSTTASQRVTAVEYATPPAAIPASPRYQLTTAQASDPSPAEVQTALNSNILPSPSTFIPVAPARPLTGGQLYQQRLAALQAGKTYTRLPVNSFQDVWMNATEQPTYEQWVDLVHQEAKALAAGQGSSQVSVLVGDSLSLWFPPEMLSGDRFWLNQGISGDTTTGILRRLSALDEIRPDTIHVMAGINDLRRGATDAEVVNNLRLIMQELKQKHPQARIIVHSILPTRLAALPTDRIRRINVAIAAATEEEGAFYLNLQPSFIDATGILNRDLTTDGLHLSVQGYERWGTIISSII